MTARVCRSVSKVPFTHANTNLALLCCYVDHLSNPGGKKKHNLQIYNLRHANRNSVSLHVIDLQRHN